MTQWHESHLEAEKGRGGWFSVLSEQMERRGSVEAVAVLKRVREVCWRAWLDELGGDWLQWAVAAGDGAGR